MYTYCVENWNLATESKTNGVNVIIDSELEEDFV